MTKAGSDGGEQGLGQRITKAGSTEKQTVTVSLRPTPPSFVKIRSVPPSCPGNPFQLFMAPNPPISQVTKSFLIFSAKYVQVSTVENTTCTGVHSLVWLLSFPFSAQHLKVSPCDTLTGLPSH